MGEQFITSKPIYLQIAERVMKKIVRGHLQPGSKLPSVRELALQFKVNPNTIQRTYSELERMEIVATRRGQGTFVTSDEAILAELREQLKREHVNMFVNDMKEMGVGFEEAMRIVRDAYGEGDR
ncbi:GntR family transcriptional regulator [Numidum massiliense]|uniref:GntR family transcriptional regulator n=1 Tax=Numidum massiliense TaxID=1522315 RepID=UPI0006D59778|nr:GntR family transcriptional regulator [Numidum massiliense]